MSQELKIVLASTSPRRITLLKQIGLEFNIIEPVGDESSSHPDPRRRVMENALAKAKSVLDQVNDHIILGADTLVLINGEVLGKPTDATEAIQMLSKLNGNVHKVFTGVAIIDRRKGKQIVDFEETLVHMRKLSNQEIRRYVASGEPMDKAGAYAIQGRGAIFIDRVVGCFHNVMGLPLSLIDIMFQAIGFNLLDISELSSII